MPKKPFFLPGGPEASDGLRLDAEARRDPAELLGMMADAQCEVVRRSRQTPFFQKRPHVRTEFPVGVGVARGGPYYRKNYFCGRKTQRND